MVRKKEETPVTQNNFDAIEGNLWATILLAKAEYERKPTNPLYSVITNLELTLMEIKKMNHESRR